MDELKICSKCKNSLVKNDKNFASRYDRGVPQFQSVCRNCQKKYRKEHYLNNKQKYIDKAHDYRDSFLAWFNKFKTTLKCEKCEEHRFWVLDFHHKDPEEKEANISKIVRDCNKEKLLIEIKKCSVLCSNCHRDLHFQEKNNR